MSASNGQRARFHRNRKRRVLLRMRLRAVMLEIKEQATAATAPVTRRGPALAGS